MAVERITPRPMVFARQCVWASLYAVRSLVAPTVDPCLVLTYHRITNEVEWPDSLVVSPEQFERQVAFLKQRFQLLSASAVADIIRAEKPFPSGSCLITFDDGWRDNYTEAFPILQAYQVPALIFLTTDYIGTCKRFWHETLARILYSIPYQSGGQRRTNIRYEEGSELTRLVGTVSSVLPVDREEIVTAVTEEWKVLAPPVIEARIKQLEAMTGIQMVDVSPAMLTWNEVDTMASAGIEFGSHTQSHALLDQITRREMKEELCSSKSVLEAHLNMPVHFIAYPNGNYNEDVIAMVREAGYLGGFTCDVGFNNNSGRPYTLKRKHVLNELSLGLRGRFSNVLFAAELSGIRLTLKAWLKGQSEVGSK